MSRYPAIDDLLATRRPLPEPAERSRLRTSLALTADEVAHAIGISPATLHAWEEGHAEPQGPARDAYAYFLTHAHTCAADQTQAAADPHLALNQLAPDTSTEPLPPHASCVLCGNLASQQVDGYPQHLTAAECAEAATPVPVLSLPKPDATPERRIPHPRSGASHRSNTEPERQERCNDPYIEKRRYEYAGGRYVGCRSCGGDLCTSCRTAHLVPADVPYEDNDDNLCPACR
ncbi:helix-turn-helix domain-containing protein [Streptomyces sp. NPDC100445]|uniref:helix-turn-helix domain-containing protein n=1 Tax=Streptomyces sp. NPDC100445 TaxID=3366102 RepID=UPI00382F3BBB